MARRLVIGLTALVLALAPAACGGGDDTSGVEDTDGAATAQGRQIFTDNCGSCHVLADAGTAGLVGPDLDEASLDVEGVEAQVREGGGGMPAFDGTLSGEEIEEVSRYVVAAQRS